MKRLDILLIIAITFMITQLTQARLQNVQVINLNQQWFFEVVDTPNQVNNVKGFSEKTSIPTTIHLDLLKYKKIQDPFYRNNYQGMQWISQSKIKYTKVFNVQQKKLKRASELVFHGIDTYSTVTLNGQEILKTNNSFVRYTVRVQNYLKQTNKLEILIESAEPHDGLGQSKNPMPFKYAHTRKACYQYSWDWAPLLITMGIWRDVELRFFDQVRIDYVWVRNKVVSNQKAILNIATKLEVNTFKGQPLKTGYRIVVGQKGSQQKVQQYLTQQTSYIDYTIQSPKFWWPNGFGNPNIYELQVCIYFKKKLIQQKTVVYGIRVVQLDLQNKQFIIKINGYNIYCKGANYVPMDMLYPRIYNPEFQTKDKTYTLKKLFDDVVASNFNMIRVWGGGQYQSDEFLEMASRRGIMLFYDFMFSDSIYPSTHQFLKNVQEEIKQQIRRTRNYPALALWSGNNQILQGVQDWGWGSANYVADYKRLFEELIRKIVTIQSPDISYIPSSPIYGVGNYGFERGGDFHYWGVWAGGSGFQSYQSAIGPFNSQFGTQALPIWHTIKQFTNEQDRNYGSPQLLAHQRHSSQFGTLRSYMERYMKPSIDFQHQVYLSGLVQAYAIQLAIRAQRSSKPKSYGTLYWQLNDAWPAISWSSIDYYGRWKPLQYMAKRTYSNLAIFTLRNGNVMAINDNFQKVDVQVRMFVIQFDGNVLATEQKNLTLDQDSVKQVFTVNAQIFSQKQKRIVIYSQIIFKNEVKMWDTKYYALTKDLQLPETHLRIKITDDEHSNLKKLIIKSASLVKNLYINHKQKYVQLSDNYFDIVPGHPRQVTIEANLSQEDIKSYFEYVSVRQASTKDTQVKITYI